MAKIEMKAADLGELYALLKMYQAAYGEVAESLIKDIEYRFETTYTVNLTSGNPISITNPRGAGRKGKIGLAEVYKLLMAQGLKAFDLNVFSALKSDYLTVVFSCSL